MTIGLIIHSLAAVLWVGGMFFAYMILRPTLQTIEPPDRLSLWQGVFKRFFRWVWMSMTGLLASGYFMIFYGYGSFTDVGLHVHVMQLVGLVMMGLFIYLYYVPWPAYRQLVDKQDYAAAAGRLGTIRKIVGANLALGLLTVAIGASGRYWG